MHALSSAVAHDLDPYVIKLLLMIVVAALSTIVALAAVIVSRFTSKPASPGRSCTPAWRSRAARRFCWPPFPHSPRSEDREKGCGR